MADNAPGTEILDLSTAFPPVSTEDWEAVIRKDLKGADYEKELVWRTDEGISVRPYYRQGESVDLAPGQYPYTRGSGQAWEEAQDFTPPPGAIRADALHEAGATAVQELAFALAEAVETFDKGETVQFVYAVGSNYFFEIAKLRAARELWSFAVKAFGEEPEPVRIHVRTARFNKSLLDPYTNLLRVTTESLSAVIGGCDSLSVEPFGFDAHLALNVQRLLRDEVHLDKVADPAGGSYYVEALTDELARAGWKLFQEVEGLGGWSAASDFITQSLAKSREAKTKAVNSRRRTMVGVNNYANVNGKLAEHAASTSETRLAEPFEKIRERTALGKAPKILLLKRGDPKMKIARANFCLNFFACAGFQLVESETYQGSDADRIVLCSSDAEYLDFAREVCAATRTPVFVAGNPKAQITELEAVGVRGFIHVLSNAVETLTAWQNELGLP